MKEKVVQTSELRSSGIGGSDAGIIIGVNKYKTPVELWKEKVECRSDFAGNEATYWGTTLEKDVADAYQNRTGSKVVQSHKTYRHKEYPFLMAHIDRRIVGEKKGLECKTALNKWWKPDQWGEPGTDEVPDSYLAQCQHYMAVTGWDSWDLAVLLSGPEFRIYHIDRNQEFIDILIERECIFWKHVVDKTPPPAVCLSDTSLLYPTDAGTSIIATSTVEGAVISYLSMKEEEKAYAKAADEAKLVIQEFMKDNMLLIDANGNELCTWKTQTSRRLDTKKLIAENPDMDKYYTESQSRVLRMKG